MRLTLVVILIAIMCIVVADAHRRRRRRDQRGRKERGGWGGDGPGQGGWGERGRGRGWSKRGGRGSNWPSRRHCQPVDGNWGTWSNYNECSLTCGFGIQKRYRVCNNPAPEYHGRRCIGRNQEERYCNQCPCPDPCDAVKCLSGGKCIRGICECTFGYSGPDCGVDSCNNICLNNATCNNGICDCPPMFSGEDCGTKLEPVDLCENITCVNNGQCISGICKCIPGYDGDNCTVNVCEITDCPGETTPCVPILAPGGYTCSCVKAILSIPSFSGCTGAPDYLEIGGTRYTGFTAPADITLSPGAGTQVRLVTNNFAGAGGYIFTYQYIDAVPDSNPCKNGGTPTSEQTCNCMAGFKGTNCEFPPILTSGGKYREKENIFFTLPGFPEKDLVLTFDEDFSIETTNGNCNDTLRNDCMEDYVEIEGTRYCGDVAPEPITIPTGKGTIVRFLSDMDAETCPIGFRLTYVYKDP
ncbi:fibropellin-1 isoform X2 [Patella vulgata]|uniref:fibropellin-1 isoform X2 n=1 Tax=Patella vulgata TaxID=6465 RepID=UPI0021807E62|nr:fibropellin-1 isoform X2 [Patella vulgata]